MPTKNRPKDFTMDKLAINDKNKVSRDSLAIPKGVKSFILAMPEIEISVEDVLHGYWGDWDTIAKRQKYLQGVLEDAKKQRGNLPRGKRRLHYLREEAPVKNDLLKLRNIPKSRTASVKLAFNQLFLAGKVKMKLYPRPEFGEDYNTPRTFDEYKAWRIVHCENEIKEVGELVKNDEGGGLMKCWLGNLYDYLESYKETEIFERRKLDYSVQRALESKGALVCLGGLYEGTWPDIIVKLDGLDYVLQGRLF